MFLIRDLFLSFPYIDGIIYLYRSVSPTLWHDSISLDLVIILAQRLLVRLCGLTMSEHV